MKNLEELEADLATLKSQVVSAKNAKYTQGAEILVDLEGIAKALGMVVDFSEDVEWKPIVDEIFAKAKEVHAAYQSSLWPKSKTC